MHSKEKQLATDPDCSVVLERMTYSMDDFVRRVFVDSLTGSWVTYFLKNLDFVNWLLIPIFGRYETLVRHRFASHVCQTLFTVSKDTISREVCFNMTFYRFISSHDTIDQRNNACFARLARSRRASIVDSAHSGCYQGMLSLIYQNLVGYLHATLLLGTPSQSPLSSYGSFCLSCCSEFAAASIAKPQRKRFSRKLTIRSAVKEECCLESQAGYNEICFCKGRRERKRKRGVRGGSARLSPDG